MTHHGIGCLQGNRVPGGAQGCERYCHLPAICAKWMADLLTRLEQVSKVKIHLVRHYPHLQGTSYFHAYPELQIQGIGVHNVVYHQKDLPGWVLPGTHTLPVLINRSDAAEKLCNSLLTPTYFKTATPQSLDVQITFTNSDAVSLGKLLQSMPGFDGTYVYTGCVDHYYDADGNEIDFPGGTIREFINISTPAPLKTITQSLYMYSPAASRELYLLWRPDTTELEGD